jgi:putative transposase
MQMIFVFTSKTVRLSEIYFFIKQTFPVTMSSLKTPLQPNRTYHLFTHAVQDSNLFLKPENYYHFLNCWKRLTHPLFTTYAYCLMPNHLHLCVKTADESMIPDVKNPGLFLSKTVSNVLSSYTQSFNRRKQQKGSLFRSRFGRIEVLDEGYFRNLICYIHHNPIHHFKRDSYEDYRFSSYNVYKQYALLTEKEAEQELIQQEAYNYVINLFNNKKDFKDFHETYRMEKRHLAIQAAVEAQFLGKEPLFQPSKLILE